MSKKKEEAEKKAGKRAPALNTLRGAKMATATSSASAASIRTATTTTPRGGALTTGAVISGPATAAPHGLWDNDDADESSAVPPPPSLDSPPSGPRPAGDSVKAAAAAPISGPPPMRPQDEPRANEIPRRFTGGISPARRDRSSSPSRSPPRRRGMMRGRSPPRGGRIRWEENNDVLIFYFLTMFPLFVRM